MAPTPADPRLQLPPFPRRVKVAPAPITDVGTATNIAKQLTDDTYAVSPSAPLLVSKLQDNAFVWGDLVCIAPRTTSNAQDTSGPSREAGRPPSGTSLPADPSSAASAAQDLPSAGLTTSTSITVTVTAEAAPCEPLPPPAAPGGTGAPLLGPAGRWAALSLGDSHAAGITARGELFTWGRNHRGQTGRSTEPASGSRTPQPVRLNALPRALLSARPTAPPSSGHVRVRAVACGGEHTLAVTTMGVLAWGCNRLGQCGLGEDAPGTIWKPTLVSALQRVPVCQLAAGKAHSLALTGASQVLVWGCGGSGQLGLGDRRARSVPVGVEGLWALPVVQIAAGDSHSAAVTSSGHAFVWGSNYHGQLGLLPEPWVEQHQEPSGSGGSAGGGDYGGVMGATAMVGRMHGGSQRHPSTVPQQQHGRHGFPHSRGMSGSPRTPCSGVGTPRSPASIRRAAMRRSNGVIGRPNPQWLLAMVEMGIPRRHAQIALEETGNAGVEVATEWLFAADRSALLEEPSDEEGGSEGPGGSAGHAGTHSDVMAAGAGNTAGTWASEELTWSEDDLVVLEPRRVPLKGVRQLAAGARHTVAVTDGGVYSWGDGSSGALGLGDCEDRDMPCKVDIFLGSGILGSLDGASDHRPSAAAATATMQPGPAGSGLPNTRGGAISRHMGAHGHGQQGQAYVRSRLGNSAEAAGAGQGRVGTAAASGGDGGSDPCGTVAIQRVACGSQHTLFLAQDGSVFWCGTMSYGHGFGSGNSSGEAAAAVAGGGNGPGIASNSLYLRRGSTMGGMPSSSGKRGTDHEVSLNGHGVGAGGVHGGGSDGAGGRAAFSTVPRLLDLTALPLGSASTGTKTGIRLGIAPAAAAARSREGCGGGSGGAGTAGSSSRGGGRDGGGGRGVVAPMVFDVVARGGSSALLMCSPQELPQALDPSTPQLLARLRTSIECAAQARAAGVDPATLSASLRAVTAGVQLVLSSPAAISAAFGRRSGMGLDGPLLEEVLSNVSALFATRPSDDSSSRGSSSSSATAHVVAELHRYSVVGALQEAAAALVEDLAAHARLLGTPERAQVLLAALQHPLLSEPACARQLMPRLAATVMAAPPLVRSWLVRWWAEYPGPLLESRVVQPLQAFLTRELGATKKLTTPVMNVIKVLARVEEAASLSRSLPPEAFYNTLISEKLDVQDHYTAWRQGQELAAGRDPPKEAPFSFCSYPFLLNARAKSHLLHLEARFQMEQSVAHARMEVQLYGGSAAARRRAEEGPVLVKTPGDAAGSNNSSGGDRSSAGSGRTSNSGSRATSGARMARRGSFAGASPSSVSPSSSTCSPSSSAITSSSGASSGSSSGSATPGTSSGSSGVMGTSLRSLFGMLLRPRRRNSASGGAGGADSAGVPGSAVAAAVTPSGAGRGTSGGGAGRASSSGGAQAAAQQRQAEGARSRSRGATLELPSPSECPMPGVHSDMCILRVRRTHLVEDALAEVGRQTRRDLLKPLRVHFIGEEGIDAGGVKKEFFALLLERLLSPDYGMMAYDETTRTYWFHPSSLEPPSSYFLLGLVVGLAVYNRVLLDLRAPLLLFQKLRGGRELGLRDLEGWQPELARGLRALLEYDGPDPMADVFGLTFSVDVDRFGRMESLPLKPGGELLPVTEDNRAEYVSLLAAWHMEGAVAEQFEAFAAGFRVLCQGPAMSLFNAQELERLVCGNPRLDFAALRDAARYEGGFSRDSAVVRWLWDIVINELSQEDQRAFLKFFTGSDRSPIGGLGSLRPVLQRDGPDCAKLPTSHTCFNTLLLPEYSSREKLGALLRLAINNSEGFGLQ